MEDGGARRAILLLSNGDSKRIFTLVYHPRGYVLLAELELDRPEGQITYSIASAYVSVKWGSNGSKNPNILRTSYVNGP